VIHTNHKCTENFWVQKNGQLWGGRFGRENSGILGWLNLGDQAEYQFNNRVLLERGQRNDLRESGDDDPCNWTVDNIVHD
jgi:hypothetical protein